MKKISLLLILIVLGFAGSRAEEFMINGINFREATSGVMVVPNYVDGENCYAGNLSIPERVSYRGVKYMVTTISSNAFKGCASLHSITIPKTITQIGDSVFSNCSTLEKIEVSSENQYYTTIKGVLYNKSITNLIKVPAYYDDKSFLLPSTVSNVAPDAFNDCFKIESINNFAENQYFSTIDGALLSKDGSKLIKVPMGFPIKDYFVPAKVIEIMPNALRNCLNIRTVSFSKTVKIIGNFAFQGCEELVRIDIPNSVSEIGGGAFSECNSLQWIEVTKGNKYFTSKDGILFNKKLTTLVQFPSNNPSSTYIVPNTVVAVADYAFALCERLVTITLPEALKKIGEGSFYGCTNLKSCNIPAGLSVIPAKSFMGCENIDAIELPASLISIGDKAFASCNELSFIELPSYISSIGCGAFNGCASLKSIVIPHSINKISRSAFSNCTSLETISVSNSVKIIEADAFSKCTSITSISLPDSLVSIGANAFSGCTNLKGIILPRSIEVIGHNAFQSCKKLENMSLPFSLTFLGSEAFSDCSVLASIFIPQKVSFLGDEIFDGCENLREIEVSKDNKWYESKEGVLYTKGLAELIRIPENWKQEKYAMPDNVKDITEGCFDNCKNLTYYEVSSNNQDYTSCDGILYNFNGEILINCPPKYNYSYVTIPELVTTIGNSAFYGCDGIVRIDLPESINTIGNYAFLNCDMLSEIYCKALKAPQVKNSTFTGFDTRECQLYIPATAYDEYARSPYWSKFQLIAE